MNMGQAVRGADHLLKNKLRESYRFSEPFSLKSICLQIVKDRSSKGKGVYKRVMNVKRVV